VSKELERYATGPGANSAVADDARLIRAEVERCRRILTRMSARGAEPVGEAPEWTAPRQLLAAAAGELAPDRASLVRTREEGEQVEVKLPRLATAQALAVLLNNAADASAEPILCTISRTQDGVRFSITDRGPGMTADVLARIGDPFFTTKEPGRGMGLGIFLVRNFAARLGGSVNFESAPGKGTTVLLDLPAPTRTASVEHATQPG